MTATDHAIALTRVAARAASDKLGDDLVAFDVSEALAITDVFLIVSASNERQVGAVELFRHRGRGVGSPRRQASATDQGNHQAREPAPPSPGPSGPVA